MIEQLPHPVFDKFPWVMNSPNPWSQDQMQRYQKRLDAIAGVTPTGMSRIRLIWGADPHTSMTIYRGQRRFKYFAGETVAVQRFFLEQLHEPAEYKPDWDKGRYEWGDTGRIDLKGDPPPDGIYTHLHTVAVHDHRCCGGSSMVDGHRPCYGFFGFPDDNELELVKMMIRLRDRLPEFRPGDSIPQSELERELRETKFWAEYQREKVRQEFAEIVADEFKTHQHRVFSDDESVLKNGRFHFLGGGHNKSGATVEQINKWRKEKRQQKESDANSDSDAA